MKAFAPLVFLAMILLFCMVLGACGDQMEERMTIHELLAEQLPDTNISQLPTTPREFAQFGSNLETIKEGDPRATSLLRGLSLVGFEFIISGPIKYGYSTWRDFRTGRLHMGVHQCSDLGGQELVKIVAQEQCFIVAFNHCAQDLAPGTLPTYHQPWFIGAGRPKPLHNYVIPWH